MGFEPTTPTLARLCSVPRSTSEGDTSGTGDSAEFGSRAPASRIENFCPIFFRSTSMRDQGPPSPPGYRGHTRPTENRANDPLVSHSMVTALSG